MTTSFPKFAVDPNYSFRRLSNFFIYYDISKTNYVKAHKIIVDANYINCWFHLLRIKYEAVKRYW